MTEDTREVKVYRVDFETITKNSPRRRPTGKPKRRSRVARSGSLASTRSKRRTKTSESTIEATEVQKTGLAIKLNTEIDRDRIEKIRELIEDDLGVQVLSIDEFVHTDKEES